MMWGFDWIVVWPMIDWVGTQNLYLYWLYNLFNGQKPSRIWTRPAYVELESPSQSRGPPVFFF